MEATYSSAYRHYSAGFKEADKQKDEKIKELRLYLKSVIRQFELIAPEETSGSDLLRKAKEL